MPTTRPDSQSPSILARSAVLCRRMSALVGLLPLALANPLPPDIPRASTAPPTALRGARRCNTHHACACPRGARNTPAETTFAHACSGRTELPCHPACIGFAKLGWPQLRSSDCGPKGAHRISRPDEGTITNPVNGPRCCDVCRTTLFPATDTNGGQTPSP